jgi:hypothetical protein
MNKYILLKEENILRDYLTIMVPLKYRSVFTHISIDKDLAMIDVLLNSSLASAELLVDFNRIGARFLISGNVSLLLHEMNQKGENESVKMYLDNCSSIGLPKNHNNQRDRNCWAQMLSVYFMAHRTHKLPSELIFSSEVLKAILNVNSYYISNSTYFDDVTSTIISRTKSQFRNKLANILDE